jgi:hypothetical protein
MSGSTYGDEPNLKWDVAPLLYIQAPFQDICLGGVITISSCLTLVPIYIDPWKSFMTFGIKKSHEMISYILVGMILLSA